MQDAVVVEAGYRAGAIGRCVEMHARFYAQLVGFGRTFEALVAEGMAEFVGRLDRPCNELWCARRGERIVGTIAIDGEDMGSGIAHLRWFIMDDEARGSGAGRCLLSEAVTFCEQQRFEAIHLWTFDGLRAARYLYEAFDFKLAEERLGEQWGSRVLEQRFARRRK